MLANSKLSSFFAKNIGIIIAVLSFTIPISHKLTIYLLELTVLFWILSRSWNFDSKTIGMNKGLIFLILLWLSYSFSLIYSENINRGFSDIIQKISLVLFPVIFITSWNSIKNYKDLMFNSFLFGLVVVSLFLLFRAFYLSFNFTEFGFNPIPSDIPWENYFLYFRFTQPYHPTYLSLYLSLGLAFVSKKVLYSKSQLQRVLLILCYVFFIVVIYLSSSKAGLIVSALVFVLSIFWILGKRSRIYAGIATVLILVAIAFSMVNNSRVMYFVNYIKGNSIAEYNFGNEELDNKLKSEATVRLEIWKNVPRIVGNSWFLGVGVGDSKKVLIDGYNKFEINYAAEAQLNTHNQYLETFVSTGLVGVIVLLLLLLIAIGQAFVSKDMLLFMFILIVSINFLFESMFERVFGVMFFSFFYCLLIIKPRVEDENEG